MSDAMTSTPTQHKRRASVTDLSLKQRERQRELHFAECRSLGHEWRKQQPIGVDDTSDTHRRPFGASTGMIGIPSNCQNCGTAKVRWITRSGESVTRYEHPDGYSRHGDERLSAQEWRSTYVATLFESFESSTAQLGKRTRKRSTA